MINVGSAIVLRTSRFFAFHCEGGQSDQERSSIIRSTDQMRDGFVLQRPRLICDAPFGQVDTVVPVDRWAGAIISGPVFGRFRRLYEPSSVQR